MINNQRCIEIKNDPNHNIFGLIFTKMKEEKENDSSTYVTYYFQRKKKLITQKQNKKQRTRNDNNLMDFQRYVGVGGVHSEPGSFCLHTHRIFFAYDNNKI